MLNQSRCFSRITNPEIPLNPSKSHVKVYALGNRVISQLYFFIRLGSLSFLVWIENVLSYQDHVDETRGLTPHPATMRSISALEIIPMPSLSQLLMSPKNIVADNPHPVNLLTMATTITTADKGSNIFKGLKMPMKGIATKNKYLQKYNYGNNN